MKKFVWRLQRVLELKARQEEMLKAELMLLGQKLASARFELLSRKNRRDTVLADVSSLEPARRLERQKTLFNDLSFLDEQIAKAQVSIRELESKRKTKMQEVLAARRFRMSLEKLRESAKDDYNVDFKRFEQDMLDETASMALARDLVCSEPL
jgi:flagellar biosynthesis chaperone FliJ